MLDAVRGGATLQGARDGALANLVERDRRLAYELAAGVLRRRGQLDRMLELATANPRLHDVLRLGAYQLRALARVPAYAAVSTSVELAREVAGEKAARYVNQALRKVARDALKDSLTVAGSGMRDAVETHPLWLVKRWKVQFGRSETERLMEWNDARAPLTLQPARWDATALRARLTKAGFGVREAPRGVGIVVQTGATHPASRIPPPAQLPGFTEGGFVVQDPAHARSTTPAPLRGASPLRSSEVGRACWPATGGVSGSAGWWRRRGAPEWRFGSRSPIFWRPRSGPRRSQPCSWTPPAPPPARWPGTRTPAGG